MKLVSIGNKKDKVFSDITELEKFILEVDGDSDDVEAITKLFKKGCVLVYYCHNPYSVEIQNEDRLIWNEDKDALEELYDVLCEEI